MRMRDEARGSSRSREARVAVSPLRQTGLLLAAVQRHVDEDVMNPKNPQ